MSDQVSKPPVLKFFHPHPIRHLLLWSAFLLSGLSLSCDDDEEPMNPDWCRSADFHFQIKLDDQERPVEMEEWAAGTLMNTLQISYETNEIIRRVKDAGGTTERITRYGLNSQGQAETWLDSVYSGDTAWIIHSGVFEYENGQVISGPEPHLFVFSQRPTGQFHFNYSRNEKGLTEIAKSFIQNGDTGTCRDIMTPGDQTARLDPLNLTSYFTIGLGPSLTTNIEYNLDCPSSPNWQYTSSEFLYRINSAGYVERMIEYFLPGAEEGLERERVIRVTSFAYE